MLEKCREHLRMKEGLGIKGKSGITPGLKDLKFFCFLTFPALQSKRGNSHPVHFRRSQLFT